MVSQKIQREQTQGTLRISIDHLQVLPRRATLMAAVGLRREHHSGNPNERVDQHSVGCVWCLDSWPATL